MHRRQAVPRYQAVFYGWMMVATALVIIAVGMGLMFSLGVFMEPLEGSLGWHRGAIAQASLYGWIAFGVFSFVFGMFSDRFGTRRVVIIGALMLGGGMVALSSMRSLWQLYLFYGGLVGGGIGAFLVPLTSTVTRWFHRRRALAVALTNCGIGLGGMLFAPLTRYLIMAFDWRATFFLYGCLAWVVIVPLTLLIRNRPEDVGSVPYGSEVSGASHAPFLAQSGYRFSTVVSTPAFWVIAVVHFLCCAAHSGPIFHMVSAVIDSGADKLAAASIFAIASLSSIPGRIGSGLLADRFGSKTVLVFWLLMQATAIVLYRFAGSAHSFAIVALYFGLAYGGVMPLYAVVAREYFGAAAMGASYGAIFFLSCVGMGLGAWFGGRIFDATGAYQLLYVFSFGLAMAGLCLAGWLRPPRAYRTTVAIQHTL